MEKAGIFTEWNRISDRAGYARIRGTMLLHYAPSNDDRKANVYCNACRQKISNMLKALRRY